MSKLTFTTEQVEALWANPYVKSVSKKSITYTDEFKRHFVLKSLERQPAKQIFQEAGFPVAVLGEQRIKSFARKWRRRYREEGILSLEDTRKCGSGRPRKTERTPEQEIERLKAQISMLEQEKELLKKLDWSERRRDNAGRPSDSFALLRQMKNNGSYTGTIQDGCDLLGISCSGYYNHLKNSRTRQSREQEDQEWKAHIEEAYSYRGYKKGSRSIVMYFRNQKGVIVNRKKIQRLMRKFEIVCPIRKANPYRRIAKATKEHNTVPNTLQRRFDQGVAGKVLLTDITYLPGKNGFLGYLSTIKDGATKEILAYYVSDNLKLDISLQTIEHLVLNQKNFLQHDAFVHSDQGVHYTSPAFQKKLSKCNLGQSMSRRGNCWDNAPQESFFGHLKDEISYQSCGRLDELKGIVDDYIQYYNEERGQWNLKKLPPAEYREQLLKLVA
jgi:transposase InsO family protein/transposase